MDSIIVNVKINCGHVFCKDCMVTMCKLKQNQPLRCPICRNIICEVSHYVDNVSSKKINFPCIFCKQTTCFFRMN